MVVLALLLVMQTKDLVVLHQVNKDQSHRPVGTPLQIRYQRKKRKRNNKKRRPRKEKRKNKQRKRQKRKKRKKKKKKRQKKGHEKRSWSERSKKTWRTRPRPKKKSSWPRKPRMIQAKILNSPKS